MVALIRRDCEARAASCDEPSDAILDLHIASGADGLHLSRRRRAAAAAPRSGDDGDGGLELELQRSARRADCIACVGVKGAHLIP